MDEINGYWLKIPKDTNRINLKHETNEWKKYRSYSLVTNAGGWKENINFPLKVIGFYDLKFTHIALDFSLMSHDIQWIHKGSSCILLRSSMSKVSCFKIHKDRKEILSSFVTKEKIIFNRRPKKKLIRQVRLNDRLNINADM